MPGGAIMRDHPRDGPVARPSGREAPTIYQFARSDQAVAYAGLDVAVRRSLSRVAVHCLHHVEQGLIFKRYRAFPPAEAGWIGKHAA